MTTITIDVDETLQAQIVYSKELDKFLRLYALSASDIEAEKAAALAKIAAAQKDIDDMTVVSVKAVSGLVMTNQSVKAGGTVDVEVDLQGQGGQIAGFQFDLILPIGLTVSKVVEGISSIAAGKTVVMNQIDKATTRFIVFGVNQNLIASGSVLIMTIQADPQMTPNKYPVTATNVQASDDKANSVPLTFTPGVISIS